MSSAPQTATISERFPALAREAMRDETLQMALGLLRTGMVERRRAAVAALPEFDALRDAAKEIKDHTLAHLDDYLEIYAEKVEQTGGVVHWCRDGDEARGVILDICSRLGARTAAKGKSMIAEEIDLNDALAAAGIEPIETDLGEYIIQLRKERPSHIVAPAIHVTRKQIEAAFRAHHSGLDAHRKLDDPALLLQEARTILRDRFLAADVGITGANFLIAETGSSIIVTNEGNGDLSQLCGRAHIVLASIEKLVPSLEDLSTLLRVLARSATGQEMSVYTTISTGPRRDGDLDGPEEYHVVLLDNGRSAMLGGAFQDILRCIRCGACMNHCPVYGAVGGHAYGGIYPGPMGAVLAPALFGLKETENLPNASSFCGKCQEVCPVRIELPKLMRHWRERQYETSPTMTRSHIALALWGALASRPALWRRGLDIGARLMRLLALGRGRCSWLPLASGWTRFRDMPAPERGASFQTLLKRRRRAAR